MLPYDENLILGYIENELGAEDRARFEAMLAEDEPLRLLIEQVVADRDLLRTLPAKEAPAILMEQVQSELERQMLADVAPSRIKAGTTPVSFRIHHRLRWAGALAAAIALAAGLSWHFDLFEASTSTPPIGELAHRGVGNDEGAPDYRSAASEKEKRHDALIARPQVSKPTGDSGEDKQVAEAGSSTFKRNETATTDETMKRDSLALAERKSGGLKSATSGQSVEKNAVEGASADPAAPTPGGKASAALAMAQKAATGDAAPAAPGAAATFGAVGDATPVEGALAFDDAAKAVDFQIELQTENVSQTRELLLAWADQNDAVEAPMLTQARSRMAGEKESLDAVKLRDRQANMRRFSMEQDAVPQDKLAEDKAQPGRESAADSDTAGAAPPSDGTTRGASKPAAAGSATEKVKKSAPAATEATVAGSPKGNEAQKPGKLEEAAVAAAKPEQESAKLGAAAGGSGGAADPASQNGARTDTKRQLDATASQVITLLVPEDRMDNLVEHIEAKTGQSLVVVREGDDLLLLSPQLANERALVRKQLQKEAAPSLDAPVASQPSATKDAAAPGPVPPPTKSDAAPPAPAPPASAPAAPRAAEVPVPAPVVPAPADEEKKAKATVRQVKVKIILAHEPAAP